MDEKLTLNNGTELAGHTIVSDNFLFVYLTGGEDMRTCFNLFIEPENTSVIHENRYGIESTHTGYTDLYSISKEYGNVNIVMRREVNQDVHS